MLVTGSGPARQGEAPIELMVSPSPIGLEGLEISVEEAAAEQLSIMGLSANQLGRRWIDRRTIEAIPTTPAGPRGIKQTVVTPPESATAIASSS